MGLLPENGEQQNYATFVWLLMHNYVKNRLGNSTIKDELLRCCWVSGDRELEVGK